MSNERLPRVGIQIELERGGKRALDANLDRARFIAAEAAQEVVMRALRSDDGEATLMIRVIRKARKSVKWGSAPAASAKAEYPGSPMAALSR